MSIMISEKWPQLLEAGLRIVFEEARSEIDRSSLIPTLFNVQSSNSAFEESASVNGLRDWFEYKGAIEYAEPEEGWGARYEHTEYVQGMIVERKLIDDAKYREINNRATMLATSAARTREKHGASIFNDAFSSTKTGGDGVALCGAHPYSPGNATTQSNKGSTALDHTSIGATLALMRGYKGAIGEHLNIQPDMLIVPPALEAAAYVALNSAGLPGSPNNDINYLQSKSFTVVVWKYLEDTNNWFMVDSTLMRRWLNWFDRVPIEFSLDPRSDFELMLRFRGYMRYSYGWDDWRWIYGHEVAGG